MTTTQANSLAALVGATHERVTVTVHGRPVAVLFAVYGLKSLEETSAVLADTSAWLADPAVEWPAVAV